MKQVIRILISGVIAGLIALGVTELQVMGLIPKSIEGELNHIYTNKQIIIFVVIFLTMFFTISMPLSKNLVEKIDKSISKYPMQEILMYIIGLGIGLYVAYLASTAFKTSGNNRISEMFILLIYIGLGCFGIYLVHLKKEEIKGWLSKKGEALAHVSSAKILDTSVIIDGRILDIINTGFIEGKIIIPSFVLDELRHIADSSDSLKRNRGRRGLDILNEIRNTKLNTVEVIDIDYSEMEEVDSKLLKLAKQIQGKVVTNDFNLNKVAKFQKVSVLNINDLANAIKQVVLPNEEIQVQIVKEGKEQEQGLAYLNDGTMIVVEKGKKYVGKTVNILVSTVLQTSAGRMIFAKVKEENK
ncbi:PIN/TRAM domain-containing protein [Cellulosilyticum ruminicola]|uniref:PIN/TRAM domain-containing protein n=1 Tax=Cellulosilyticum ruminicola TaxID=425254 RepID=UPI0006CFB03F|nr:PIN domain-containing protein [Cellulosilyticum ruminicola]